MRFRGFPAEAFEFYAGLKADNSRPYWMANRKVYEESVRAPLQALLDDVADDFGTLSVFRPNRDTRFSADKTPYKTHHGATGAEPVEFLSLFGRQGERAHLRARPQAQQPPGRPASPDSGRETR